MGLLPRQRSYSGVHSKTLLTLLFVFTFFIQTKVSEGCKNRTYPVLLREETLPLSNTTEKSANAAVNKTFVGMATYCTSKLETISNGSEGVIAELKISVKAKDATMVFEDALLNGITYGAMNRTIQPLSRVFVVAFNLSDPSTDYITLEDAIKKVIGHDNSVTCTLLKNESEYRELRLWLNITGPQYPMEALKSLKEAVQNSSINGLSVQSNSFKAYTRFPVSDTKDFRVEFDFYVSECDASKMSNTSSVEYKSLYSEVVILLNATYREILGYIDASIESLKCGSSSARALSSSVRVTALVEMQKSSSSTPLSMGGALKDCAVSSSKVSNLQVTLMNPSSLGDSTQATITCPTTTKIPPTTLGSTKKTLPSTEPSTAPPTLGKTPRLFVRLRMAITWSQFCSKLEDSLKHRIAKNVYDKEGNSVSADRVVFINSNKNCADPTKVNDQVDLWFYISDKTGSNKPSMCVTLKAQRVLKMMIINGNTKLMGSDFAGKIISADLAGCDAKKFDNKDKEMDWTTVMIILAGVVGAILLLLACCCFCCGAARRRRRRRHDDKHSNMELIVVENAYEQANGEGAKANGEKGKAGTKPRHRPHNQGRGAKGYGADSDDSDEYYNCCGGGSGGSGGGGGGGAGKKNKDGKKKDKKKNKYKKSKGDDDGDGSGKGGKDEKGKDNNNDKDNDKDKGGQTNEAYEDMSGGNLDKSGGGQGNSTPQSYRNVAYGLGDRKSNGEYDYATIGEPNKQASRGGGDGTYVNVENKGGGIGGTGGAAKAAAVGGGAVLAGGAAAGLLAGSMNNDGNKRSSLTPAIVTSPAPDTGPTTNAANIGGSPGERRGSSSKGGSPASSRASSGHSLNNVDDEAQRERRRSSIHSFLDEDTGPLKHKTATVGIVGLALRNKNERKKETEFKNLEKDMPALGTYPANTAGKNRFPEILPNPRSRVKISSSPDYINASYLHDHKGQRHYIATQHPLQESKDDFWQMVWEQESYLVVMVNDDENSKQMEYPQYWPAAEGSSMDFNGIVVSNKHVTTKTDYVITNLVITNSKIKPSVTREISHYRYTSWKDKTVPNVAMFVGFVVATREIGRKYEDGKCPVIVHCSDGQGFTGVFVALDIGIRSHEESKNSVVDLFELAKRLRQGRCGMINSLPLYNFAYQCLYEYTVNYDEEAEKKKDA